MEELLPSLVAAAAGSAATLVVARLRHPEQLPAWLRPFAKPLAAFLQALFASRVIPEPKAVSSPEPRPRDPRP